MQQSTPAPKAAPLNISFLGTILALSQLCDSPQAPLSRNACLGGAWRGAVVLKGSHARATRCEVWPRDAVSWIE